MGNSVKPISNEKTEASVYGMDDSPRGKLLSAAARLFRDQGFDRTTVRDIAREVGLQSGSNFHHFATKEDILQRVMEGVARTTACDIAREGGLQCGSIFHHFATK